MAKIYQPSPEIITKYAQVLVNYGLNSGLGVKPGEVVLATVPDVAKPMALALQNVLLQAGAYPMIRLLPTGFDKAYFTYANNDQLTFFPKDYLKAQAKLIDHQISIIAEPFPEELKDVDHAKIFTSRDAKKEYRDWLTDKESDGHFTWTLGLWGEEVKARTVGLSLETYWDQIIQACFLDKEDPIGEWRRIQAMQVDILKKLNSMKIDHLEIKGPDIDLTVKLGANRIWQGGSGRNIPSFEFFTSPDWRGTEGWVKFNQPLYRYGNVVEGISLRFSQGKVVEAKARKGQEVLTNMLKTKNADQIGEYSLTDRRMSRITHVMAETLYDENIGGPFGNTHLAVGMAYRDCFRGDQSKVTKEEWEAMGFNDSAEHTDIVSTTDRTATAFLTDGSQRVIYQGGEFVL